MKAVFEPMRALSRDEVEIINSALSLVVVDWRYPRATVLILLWLQWRYTELATIPPTRERRWVLTR